MPTEKSITPRKRDWKITYRQIKADPVRYAAYLEQKRKQRARKQADREYETNRKRKWREANPERNRLHRQAHYAVEQAIKKGQLVRPSQCDGCGIECTPEGHHYRGYEPEFWLIVKWLCEMCHKAEHRRVPNC